MLKQSLLRDKIGDEWVGGSKNGLKNKISSMDDPCHEAWPLILDSYFGKFTKIRLGWVKPLKIERYKWMTLRPVKDFYEPYSIWPIFQTRKPRALRAPFARPLGMKRFWSNFFDNKSAQHEHTHTDTHMDTHMGTHRDTHTWTHGHTDTRTNKRTDRATADIII